jgi:hypothetical protein
MPCAIWVVIRELLVLTLPSFIERSANGPTTLTLRAAHQSIPHRLVQPRDHAFDDIRP